MTANRLPGLDIRQVHDLLGDLDAMPRLARVDDAPAAAGATVRPCAEAEWSEQKKSPAAGVTSCGACVRVSSRRCSLAPCGHYDCALP